VKPFLKHQQEQIGRATRISAFTLVEVVIAVAILSLTFAGVIYGYVLSAQRAEWSAYSLAAQSLASQGVEQVRSAKWDPGSWPLIDELPPTNFAMVETLDVPISGTPVFATNLISVSDVSTNPAIRQIRVDCTWMFVKRGPFTNTMITFRAPDQ
jgi:type II secretory pathway pseudopilin PulG